MLKRGLMLLLIGVVAVSLLGGCGDTSNSTPEKASESKETQEEKPVEKAKITLSSWLEVEESTAGIFKEMIDTFKAKNANVEVETIGLPFNQYKDQILVMASSGNAPDVIMGNSQMMVGFYGANALAPLDSLIKKDIQKDIFDNNLAGTTFGGKIIALPWVTHPNAMFYNKELFKKAGLDPETPPATWDDMIAAAKKIAALKQDENGNKIYGIGHAIAKGSHAGAVTNGIIYAFDGHFLDKDGKVDFDNAGTHEAFKYIKEMVDAGIMPSGTDQKDIRGLFANQQLGIMFDGDFGRGVFRQLSGKGEEFDKIMGIATIPVHKTGKSETVYTEHQLGVAKDSKSPKVAAALVEHLVSKDIIIKYHKSNAILAPSKSIGSLPDMNEDYYMEVFNKQLQTARPLPATKPIFDNAMLEVSKALERVTIGGEDVGTVIKETQKKLEELYAQ